MARLSSLLGSLCFLLFLLSSVSASFQIGAGIYDITGPVTELRFFGYADVAQTGKGLHLRLRARSYFITEPSGKNVVYVHTDLWAGIAYFKTNVIEKLEEIIPGEVTFENLMIGCTHTHSGPGGYAENFLYNIPALGYSEESYNTIINGLVESILRARENRQSGRILINKGDIEGVAKNRSPTPYNNNPASERARYPSDTDKEMVLLKFVGDDGTEIGTIGFHAVHAVSMKIDNRLVSSDNKGYASVLFEKLKSTNYQSKKGFAASFPISNAGDISPNTGPVLETGEFIGEGKDYFESTKISATRMFEQAQVLYDTASEALTETIDYRFTNVDMSNVYVESVNASTVPAALGYSFAAGTPDGIAFGLEYLGRTEVNPQLERVSKLFANYSDEFQEAHGKKPILIPAGLTRPASMVPQILSLQLVRIGQLAIIAFPSEITTMAGRRLKETVLAELRSAGITHVALSALTNGYAQYVVTKEEYDIQWYEGASTYFGPYTLLAYQQEFARLASALASGSPSPSGPALDERPVREVLPGHRGDDPIDGYDFGDVIVDAVTSYQKGQVVNVTFAGANPRANLRIQDTYLTVERQEGASWVIVAYDWDWETKLHWEEVARGQSLIHIEWEIPETTVAGTYRIHYYGDEKSRLTGRVSSFEGLSSSFQVL